MRWKQKDLETEAWNLSTLRTIALTPDGLVTVMFCHSLRPACHWFWSNLRVLFIALLVLLQFGTD